jgi:hypothetical protein
LRQAKGRTLLKTDKIKILASGAKQFFAARAQVAFHRKVPKSSKIGRYAQSSIRSFTKQSDYKVSYKQ